MFGILHIPFQGSWLLLNVMTVLFIIATQALALFIFSLFPAVAIIISIVSMVGSLGATLSGVTFPVLNMYPLVRDASYLFPVRLTPKLHKPCSTMAADLSTYGLRQ